MQHLLPHNLQRYGFHYFSHYSWFFIPKVFLQPTKNIYINRTYNYGWHWIISKQARNCKVFRAQFQREIRVNYSLVSKILYNGCSKLFKLRTQGPRRAWSYLDDDWCSSPSGQSLLVDIRAPTFPLLPSCTHPSSAGSTDKPGLEKQHKRWRSKELNI